MVQGIKAQGYLFRGMGIGAADKEYAFIYQYFNYLRSGGGLTDCLTKA